VLGEWFKLRCRAPLISVIMPSYNHERFVSSAISSVLSQTIQDFELIIVDDCSTDKSRQIVQRWAQKDSRIMVILHSENLGISKTVNDGISAATGKYVILIASDDLFKLDAFEKALRILEREQVYGAAVFDTEWIDDRNRRITRFSDYYVAVRGDVGFSTHTSRPLEKDVFFNQLARCEGLIGVGLVRKSILDAYQIRFDERLTYCSDNLFWLELSYVCDLFYLGEALYFHRIHRDNTYNTIRIRGALHADHIIELQIVLSKYWNDLDNVSKSVLLHELGRRHFGVSDFSKAKECFIQSASCNPNVLGRMATMLMVLALAFASMNRVLLICLHKLRREILATFTVAGRRGKYFSKIFATIWGIESV